MLCICTFGAQECVVRCSIMQVDIDTIVGLIVHEYYNQNAVSKKTMSRQKLPCTRCGTHVASTWRPGPCGTSSLCNTCGVMYMDRCTRPRMVDLVMDEGRCVWMARHQDTLQWYEDREADIKDKRVVTWVRQEKERNAYVESKKRKFVDM